MAIEQSLYSKPEVAQGVYDSNGCDSAANNSQHLPDKIVKGGVMLLINYVDWLDLSHKHGLLSSIMAEGPPRTNRISVVFNGCSLITVFLNDHWYDFEVVEVVYLLLLLSEILNHLAGHEISF